MSKPLVYVSRPIPARALARLQETLQVRSWGETGRCPSDRLVAEVGEAEAVLGTDRWTAEMMDRTPQLRLIALTAVGFDMVDIAAATARGILVTHTPDVLTDTVADLVFALMLAVARGVPSTERWLRAGNWKTLGATPMGVDVHHATLGIVGLGRIGQAVARRAAGFDMRIVYYDTIRRQALEAEHGYRYAELDALLSESDFVTLHTALTPETKGMIGAAALARMKPTAFLINAARGPIIDEAALIAALRAGTIAGAGLDVFEKEPLDPASPLLAMDNVVALPHVGSATQATRDAMVELAADNILAVLGGQPPVTPVNREAAGRRR